MEINQITFTLSLSAFRLEFKQFECHKFILKIVVKQVSYNANLLQLNVCILKQTKTYWLIRVTV